MLLSGIKGEYRPACCVGYKLYGSDRAIARGKAPLPLTSVMLRPPMLPGGVKRWCARIWRCGGGVSIRAPRRVTWGQFSRCVCARTVLKSVSRKKKGSLKFNPCIVSGIIIFCKSYVAIVRLLLLRSMGHSGTLKSWIVLFCA